MKISHDKNKIQLEFALMLRNFMNIPKWKILKRWKAIKEINKFEATWINEKTENT